MQRNFNSASLGIYVPQEFMLLFFFFFSEKYERIFPSNLEYVSELSNLSAKIFHFKKIIN